MDEEKLKALEVRVTALEEKLKSLEARVTALEENLKYTQTFITSQVRWNACQIDINKQIQQLVEPKREEIV